MSHGPPSAGYPDNFGEVAAWAKERGVTLAEARQRFAQYAVLRGIASSATLREMLVFKGGNALDFAWSPYRSTRDLDFSVDMASLGGKELAWKELGSLFSAGLAASQRELGVAMAVHGVERQPPGAGKTFVTFTVKVGYALPDDARNRTRLQSGSPSQAVVPVEVSLNEPVCADERLDLAGTHRALRVSTLEDIVAEKLRAWLQQSIRNRSRPQDLLDIARVLESGRPLDCGAVSRFLIEKSAARGVPVSRTAFKDPSLAERARRGYDERLEGTVSGDFVPFDEALQRLYEFVEKLELLP